MQRCVAYPPRDCISPTGHDRAEERSRGLELSVGSSTPGARSWPTGFGGRATPTGQPLVLLVPISRERPSQASPRLGRTDVEIGPSNGYCGPRQVEGIRRLRCPCSVRWCKRLGISVFEAFRFAWAFGLAASDSPNWQHGVRAGRSNQPLVRLHSMQIRVDSAVDWAQAGARAMNTASQTSTSRPAGTTQATAQTGPLPPLSELLDRIKSSDVKVRGLAWQGAAPYGAAAVAPLAEVAVSHPDFEVVRAAKRALWKIVRHAGRPHAQAERKAVERELIKLLDRGDPNVRREFVWMLSEIGGNASVSPLAALLHNKDLREDARAALQRIPGRSAVAALKAALKTVPEDYRPAVAVSLRARGQTVKGYPSQKLVATRPPLA